MEFVGEAVEHGHAGISGQLFHDGSAEAAILDAVIHAAEHAGGVFDAFFVTDLAAGGLEIGNACALVHRGHFKSAAGAGGSFLENQGDVFAFELRHFCAGFFGRFQFGRRIEQIVDFGGGEIEQF